MPSADTTLGMIVYNAAHAALPDVRAFLRFDRKTVVACVCGGIGASRAFTEQGTANDSSIEAHLPTSTVPKGGLALGERVEFSKDGTAWNTYLVTGRNENGGLVGIVLGDINGGL